MQIKFQKYYVTNGQTKVRCIYSVSLDQQGRKLVRLYASDYGDALSKIFAEGYENNTEINADYVDYAFVTLLHGHPLFEAALVRAEQNKADFERRYGKEAA